MTRQHAGIAVFRADASPECGGGHVVRCMALAAGLSGAGWLCRFTVRPPTLEAVPALRASGHEVLELAGDEVSEPRALAGAWPDGVDWLVVDHYGRGAPFESACRPWARRIMVIDDLADRPHDCDLLLDQTLGRSEEDYADLVPDGCWMMFGPAHALLRPQFTEGRAAALAQRKAGGPVRRILVSMGATDLHDVTPVVLEGIRRAGLAVEVDVVLGPASPNLAELQSMAARMSFPVSVHVDVDDMAELMGRADLAIGGAGSSSWERCCLGLPTLSVITVGNQCRIAYELERRGAIKVLGWYRDLTADGIGAALAAAAGDSRSRQLWSARAAEVCDGHGAKRVRDQLLR